MMQIVVFKVMFNTNSTASVLHVTGTALGPTSQDISALVHRMIRRSGWRHGMFVAVNDSAKRGGVLRWLCTLPR